MGNTTRPKCPAGHSTVSLYIRGRSRVYVPLTSGDARVYWCRQCEITLESKTKGDGENFPRKKFKR